MPTQEERMAAVEQAIIDAQQFQSQTASRLRANNENTTMLLGIVSEQEKDIKAILRTLEKHTAVLEQHTATLDQHTTILMQHGELLMQHGAILQQHSTMLQEILDRLPAKE